MLDARAGRHRHLCSEYMVDQRRACLLHPAHLLRQQEGPADTMFLDRVSGHHSQLDWVACHSGQTGQILSELAMW